jgi:hypothetical protein
MAMRILSMISLLAGSSFGCIKQGMAPGNTSPSSKVTSVKMKMPTKIGDKDVSGKMDGYHLSVKKIGGNCVFSEIDRTEKIAAGDVKIDASLKQGCDYSFILSFGIAATDGKSLEKTYLTSDAYDGKSANATIVKQDDIKGRNEITIKACVSVTPLGAKDLGVSVAECPSVSDDSVNGTLEPVIPQPNQTTFKVSKAPLASMKDGKVLITGELTAVSPKTVYCGLGLNIKIIGWGTRMLYIDDSVIEAKLADKKSFDKSFDAKDIPDMDPGNLGAITIFEFCSDVKPDPTKKAADLLRDCMATGKCPVVGA